MYKFVVVVTMVAIRQQYTLLCPVEQLYAPTIRVLDLLTAVVQRLLDIRSALPGSRVPGTGTTQQQQYQYANLKHQRDQYVDLRVPA